MACDLAALKIDAHNPYATKVFREMQMKEKMGVISPQGLQTGKKNNVTQHIGDLKGKTICEVYNNHFKGEQMFHAYRRLFTEKFPGIKIIPYDEFPIVYVGADPELQRKTAKEIAALAKERGCDAVISGNGG